MDLRGGSLMETVTSEYSEHPVHSRGVLFALHIRGFLNQLLGFRYIRTNFKKINILFEAEILEANHGISYSIFECFGNFQIATKISKIGNFLFDENKIKTFWVLKIFGPRFPPMVMHSIEKVC